MRYAQDPAEGAALGMAILRHLAIGRHAALTFATTHHGELKTLKYSTDESAGLFENASVEFDDVRMQPTYRLQWGVPGRSNALAIASRLGLGDSIVQEAKDMLTGGEGAERERRVDVEQMVISLEREKNEAEQARTDAERAREEVVFLRNELRTRLERLQTGEKTMRLEQQAAIDKELMEAKSSIAKVIRDMQRSGQSAQAAGKASQRLEQLTVARERSSRSIPSRENGRAVKDTTELQVGDAVTVATLGNSAAEIVDILNTKEVMVAVGGMRAKVKAKEILDVRRERRAGAVPRTTRAVSNEGNTGKKLSMRTAANTIDIRGERVDEAVAHVDAAIAKAIPLGAAWIIHGHGTGRLRTGIREHLARHELVSRLEDADQSDGGRGVTIAYLN